jgi:hypothetical protein
MTTQSDEQDDQNTRWEMLRNTLHETDIETYYAVHSDGNHQGWKGLSLILDDKIKTHMDEIRRLMRKEKDEIQSAKLRGRIDGLRDALQLITESNT